MQVLEYAGSEKNEPFSYLDHNIALPVDSI